MKIEQPSRRTTTITICSPACEKSTNNKRSYTFVYAHGVFVSCARAVDVFNNIFIQPIYVRTRIQQKVLNNIFMRALVHMRAFADRYSSAHALQPPSAFTTHHYCRRRRRCRYYLGESAQSADKQTRGGGGGVGLKAREASRCIHAR